MNREQALKQAEEMVSKLAPAQNARGYADGVAPLEQRVSQILRIAEFLYDGEKDAPAPVVIDSDGDRWTLVDAAASLYEYNGTRKVLGAIASEHGVQRIETV